LMLIVKWYVLVHMFITEYMCLW